MTSGKKSETSNASRGTRSQRSAGESQFSWQAAGTGPEDIRPLRSKGRWSTRFRVFLGFVFFFLFFAMLVLVFLWLRPASGTAMVLVGAGYEDNLAVPHNVYGRETLNSLARLAESHQTETGKMVVRRKELNLANAREWDKRLRNIPQKNIVIYLAMHGATDAKGAYLLPQNTMMPRDVENLLLDESKLRLTAILDKLAELPRNRNVVLILDATALTSSWSLGILHNNFARELENLNERIAEIPNLIVLSASGIDQRSWASPELRRTIFGHFVTKGLEGHADENEDKRVTALELHGYVLDKVQRWVAFNRGALQTPVLLPLGDKGTRRAGRMKIAVAKSDLSEEDSVSVFDSEQTGKTTLRAAWQTYSDLNKSMPHPAVSSPALWRLYRDVLLRYEELIVAGDTLVTPDLARRLRGLTDELRQQQTLPLDSLESTLPSTAIAGVQRSSRERAGAVLDELRQVKKDEDLEKIWKKVKGEYSSDPLGLRLFQVQLLEVLLEQTAKSTEPDLDKAHTIIRLIDDPVGARPAEAHYVVMLRKDLPQENRVDAQALGESIETRLEAERAALGLPTNFPISPINDMGYYCEQVVPWIKKQVEAADQRRLFGQDLMFTSSSARWQQGRDHLRMARDQLYRRASETGQSLRQAFAIRDRVFSDAPYLARWIAKRCVAAPREGKKPDGHHRDEFVKLLRETHQLHALLGPPDNALTAEVRQARVSEIEKLAKSAQSRFEGLREQFTKFRNRLEQADTGVAWRDINDALVVPFDSAKVRVEFLTKRSRIGQRLHVRTATATNESDGEVSQRSLGDIPAKRFAVSVNENQKLAKDHGYCQGLMALELLGERWFDKTPTKVTQTHEQVQHQLVNFRVEQRWWDTLAWAGDEIGIRWRQIPLTVNNLEKLKQTSTLAEVEMSLRRADYLSRLMNSPGKLLVPNRADASYRQFAVQKLLLWQTQRTYKAHWYAEDATTKPYFRKAGETYLDDAKNLFENNPEVARLRDQLNQVRRLTLRLHSAPGLPKGQANPKTFDGTLRLTTEREAQLEYELVGEDEKGGLLDGYPVVWMEPGAYLAALNPEQLLRRTSRIGGDGAPRFQMALTSSKLTEEEVSKIEAPKTFPTSLVVEGVFRGQPIAKTTPVVLHPVPQTVKITHPLPYMGSVAVRASKVISEKYGTSTGTVAVVLDASGSMGEAKGEEFGPQTKFAQATLGLQALLQSLPKGTRLSLWVFGQKLGDGKDEQPEATVRRLLRPTVWDPEDPILLKRVMSQVEYPKLTPWNKSPLIRTMLRATREDLARARGRKHLIVITDGIDNRIQDDIEYNPKIESVPVLLRENFKDIQISVVGFRVPGAEQELVKKQFEALKDLSPPGTLYRVEEAAKLLGTLRQVFRQRLRYYIDNADNTPVTSVPNTGLDVSKTGSNIRWTSDGLLPGNYKVRAYMTGRVARSFTLNPSDLLLLELAPRRTLGGTIGSPTFQRVLFSDAFPVKRKKVNTDWIFAAVQNQLRPDGSLQLLTTLDRKLSPLATTLENIKPKVCWIELDTPNNQAESFTQRWHYQPGYSTAAWSFDVPKWPVRKTRSGQFSKSGVLATPVVRIWWTPDREPRGVPLRRGHDFRSPDEIENRVVSFPEAKVVVESVRVEKHTIETQRSNANRAPEREPRSCLVVRLAYPKDYPVMVKLNGLVTSGSEHRYFTKANKCTALFWPVSPEQAERVVESIEIISLSQFQRDSEKRNFFLKMDNLYPPSPSDVRPKPLVDLTSLRVPADVDTINNPLKEKKKSRLMKIEVPTTPTSAPSSRSKPKIRPRDGVLVPPGRSKDEG